MNLADLNGRLCKKPVDTTKITGKNEMMKFLTGNEDSPEALAIITQNADLIKHYFPKFLYKKDLEFFRQYLINVIRSRYLKGSVNSRELSKWFDIIGKSGSTDSSGDVTIQILPA